MTSVEQWQPQAQNPIIDTGFTPDNYGAGMVGPPFEEFIPDIDQWYREFEQPDFTLYIQERRYLYDPWVVDTIMDVQSDNGDFAYLGNITPEITPISITVSGGFVYVGTLGLELDSISVITFAWSHVGTIGLKLNAPATGVVSFTPGVPGVAVAQVSVDGLNISDLIQGTITVILEDNTAARFEFAINSNLRAVEFINKEIDISFLVTDNSGGAVDYHPIFNGVCKRVKHNYDSGEYIITGFDYGGIHQTKGEFISEDITEVLTGNVYINGAGSFDTGKSPIWGVKYSGSADVKDGRDYFVDTLNGVIKVPVSSTLVQFPYNLTFSYMVPFGTLKLLIEDVLAKKGWTLEEDGVTLTDYTAANKQPVLSVSNESVIDVARKFLELSGAKVQSNLFPVLRVYSELENFILPAKHTIDQSIILEDTLTFDVDISGLINKQTVRSVQKTNASISISASTQLAKESGVQGAQVLLSQLVPPSSVIPIDFSLRKTLVTVRLGRDGIFSLNYSVGGTLSLPPLSSPITKSHWTQRIEDNNFVFELKSIPYYILTNMGADGWFWYVAYPAADWSLTVNGKKISYGDASVEGVVEVTGDRPITGLTDVLAGDVYENPYIETSAHAANITNAILVEFGNVYFSNGQIPIYAGESMKIGDKVDIYNLESELFSGLIKVLRYDLNMSTGKNTINMGMQGVGFAI